MSRELCQTLISLRFNNPAWLLLASSKAPLTASCLKTILDAKPIGVPWEDAVEALADIFTEHASDETYEIAPADDQTPAARKEMRRWLRLGLVVERDGQLMATDGLERALHFLGELESRTMTSTASRLATVQREIENLEARLNANQERRIESIRDKIRDLEEELAAAERGEFEVLIGPPAQEGSREIHQLALSLRADFRRVEDSYREADQNLRQRILGEGSHRGEIVDNLLDSHDDLVQTPEGQVFESFHEQLVKPLELERMKARLKSILQNAETPESLDRRQRHELHTLIPNLVSESRGVIHARARSERDVRSFLKSGLADEHVRVGALLNELSRVALDVDWSSQIVRRTPSPLPPVGVALAQPNVRLAERLTFRDSLDDESVDLDLTEHDSKLDNLGEDFWKAFQALDRTQLFEDTLATLKESGEPLTIARLAELLPPTHDLENLAYWLGMAREAGILLSEEVEQIDLEDETEGYFRFVVPRIDLDFEQASNLNTEALG
ncbi:MAG: DUF3375 family protein [Verrucomicrobiota bacterium]